MKLIPITKPAITIWADESCLGNQNVGRERPGACAGIVEIEGRRLGYAHAVRDTTNNRMAILSAIVPLRLIPKDVEVRFVSDSQYVIRNASEFLAGWVAKGWRGSKGPVENRDLWQELANLLDGRAIEFVWVKGHAADEMNNLADAAAVEAASTQSSFNDLEDSQFRDTVLRLAGSAERTDVISSDLSSAGSATPEPFADSQKSPARWGVDERGRMANCDDGTFVLWADVAHLFAEQPR